MLNATLERLSEGLNLLAMRYVDHAFTSVVHLMQDINVDTLI
jgi:hypothetical protein